MPGLLLSILLAGGVMQSGQEAPQKPPTFRASTELVLIDAYVVARDGTPVQGLKADQFEVFVDGRRRPVVSAEFVSARDTVHTARSATDPDNAAAHGGRIIMIAVDQGSFPVSGQAAAREAATRVVDGAAADDYLGMMAFPGPVRVAPTRDRAVLREAITRIAGLRTELYKSRFNISASEASLLKSRDTIATQDILARECPHITERTCRQEVIQDGANIADELERQAVQSLGGLEEVFDATASIPGRKTLIVISAGVPMRPGGRPDLSAETTRIARQAAAANINVYVLYLNVHFLRYFSAEYGKRNSSIFEDISMFGSGLERIADSAGGSFFQVEVDSDPFVARALRETSAAYLLAVQVKPEDRDGKDHFIRVTVKQRGTTLRYRRVVNIPTAR